MTSAQVKDLAVQPLATVNGATAEVISEVAACVDLGDVDTSYLCVAGLQYSLQRCMWYVTQLCPSLQTRRRRGWPCSLGR